MPSSGAPLGGTRCLLFGYPSFKAGLILPMGSRGTKLLGLGSSVTQTIAPVRPPGGLTTLPVRGQDPREPRTGIPLAPALLFWLGART